MNSVLQFHFLCYPKNGLGPALQERRKKGEMGREGEKDKTRHTEMRLQEHKQNGEGRKKKKGGGEMKEGVEIAGQI